MSKNRLIVLDGLRGVAALAVVIYHRRWLAPSGHLLDHANLAVDFFFLLSGFVITLSYQQKIQKGMNFREFMVSRIIRLYPLYIVGLLLGAVIWVVKIHVKGGDTLDVIVPFLSMLLFLPALRPLPGNTLEAYPLNSPAWSLSFEMMINIIFFFIAKHKIYVAIAIFTAAAAWLASAGNPLGGYYYDNLLIGIPRVAASFTLGMLVCKVFEQISDRRLTSSEVGGASFVVLACILVAVFWPDRGAQDGNAYDLAMMFLVFPIIILCGAMVQIQGRFADFVEFTGDLSYPIYILHYPIFYLGEVVIKVHKSFSFPLSLPIILIFSYLIWRFYDLPLRKRLRGMLRRYNDPAAAKATA